MNDRGETYRKIEQLLQAILAELPPEATVTLLCHVDGERGFDLVLTNEEQRKDADLLALMDFPNGLAN
jgi:hypothetical protein